MIGNDARVRRASLLIVATLFLGACTGTRPISASDEEVNVYPANYKSDILSAMHVYLNNPAGIRDAAISAPALKSVEDLNRYVVCVQFNAKKNATEYAGVKEFAAVFVVGHFDRFVEKGHEPCTGAAYTPFPELQKLSR
jgi:hypothetical protein